ncbi:MAG: RidA family protein [Pirellulales bacterium]|nr:RidA family protein [Pirellulales bacterium]
MSAETRFQQLRLALPPAPKAIGLYRPILLVDGLAYLSGHGPLRGDGSAICGCLGDDLDVEAGFQAAYQAGLTTLATLRAHFDSLDRLKRLVKTVGMVRATPDFTDQPAVINGFSQLMREVFGEDFGIAARSAVGVASLPAGWAVEIETVFEVVA